MSAGWHACRLGKHAIANRLPTWELNLGQFLTNSSPHVHCSFCMLAQRQAWHPTPTNSLRTINANLPVHWQYLDIIQRPQTSPTWQGQRALWGVCAGLGACAARADRVNRPPCLVESTMSIECDSGKSNTIEPGGDRGVLHPWEPWVRLLRPGSVHSPFAGSKKGHTMTSKRTFLLTASMAAA